MTESGTTFSAAICVVDRLAIAVALSALIVFAGIVITNLPAGVTPPHYAPPVFTASSGAAASSVSSSGILDFSIPSEGWAALAGVVIAGGVRNAIAHRWPGLSERESATESQTTNTTPENPS
jgi:hypothetical protein